MSSQSLSARLRALENSYKQVLQQIQALSNWTPRLDFEGPSRAELASEIHQSLKEQQDALEVLRQELDNSPWSEHDEIPLLTRGRWVGGGSTVRRESEQDQQRERNVTTVARLSEDLSSAHKSFRQAQLKSKRGEDAARRKERDELFTKRGIEGEQRTSARRQGQGPVTQDEMAINAANDVTASLRRMHGLMEENLQQSDYAQQVLAESSQALAGLSENYSGMDGLLKSSRGLVSQLLRSNKSDTWYLTTSFYVLCATLAWLVFRRLLYGPLWWFAYLPLRICWWMIMTTLSAVGIVGDAEQKIVAISSPAVSTPGYNAQGRPTLQPGSFAGMEVKAKGAGWGGSNEPPQQDDSMAEKIGKMVEESTEGAERGRPALQEGSEEKGEAQEGPALRNSKKRMLELEKEHSRTRDEL